MKSSIYAGILIGIAGWINLSVGGIIGAVLFSLGLLLICYQSLDLYTGKAGSVPVDFWNLNTSLISLCKIFFGNIIGVAIVSIITTGLVTEQADSIIAVRESTTWYNALAKGIGCGALMEFAVWGWREKKTIIPIFLCVPGFILSGMYHSVADGFYIMCSSWSEMNVLKVLLVWVLSFIGNFIGCNLRRLLS